MSIYGSHLYSKLIIALVLTSIAFGLAYLYDFIQRKRKCSNLQLDDIDKIN